MEMILKTIEVVAAPIVIGLLSAFFGARFALLRHRREKIWEKKVDAYTELVDSLHHMKRTRDRFFEAAKAGGEVQTEEANRLWEQSRTARRRVERAADTGAFLISAEIGRAVEELESAMEAALDGLGSDSWIDLIIKERNAIVDCLARVKRIARKELGLES